MYTKTRWKGTDLQRLSQTPSGLAEIQDEVNRIKANLKPNEVILNDNLAELGVQV